MSAMRLVRRCIFAALLCLAAAPPARAQSHRVSWTATRVSDKTLLMSASGAINVGGSVNLRTDSQTAEQDKPALPRINARLKQIRRRPGEFQLVSRVWVLELTPNKKGRLKRTKRFIGSLLPIRPGETQTASSAGDAIRVEVRLE